MMALNYLSGFLIFASVFLIVAYGKFDNEFLRITVTVTSVAFTVYVQLHWIIRVIGIGIHIFVIIVFETYFFRELLLQLACFEIGKFPPFLHKNTLRF